MIEEIKKYETIKKIKSYFLEEELNCIKDFLNQKEELIDDISL